MTHETVLFYAAVGSYGVVAIALLYGTIRIWSKLCNRIFPVAPAERPGDRVK